MTYQQSRRGVTVGGLRSRLQQRALAGEQMRTPGGAGELTPWTPTATRFATAFAAAGLNGDASIDDAARVKPITE